MNNIDFEILENIMQRCEFPTQLTITQHGDYPTQTYTLDVYRFNDTLPPVAECIFSQEFSKSI